jgi:hypothetical protein
MSERPAPAVVLAALTAEEKASVLDELVAADPRLGTSAAHAAWAMLSDVAVDDVAARVADALLALDQDDLAARAGPTRYGYVEPTQAAWELLEEALEPWLEDIGRRVRLSLVDSALFIACGVVVGLRSVDGCDHDDRLLSWVPDFPVEAAESVRRALLQAGVDPGEPRIERALSDWR